MSIEIKYKEQTKIFNEARILYANQTNTYNEYIQEQKAANKSKQDAINVLEGFSYDETVKKLLLILESKAKSLKFDFEEAKKDDRLINLLIKKFGGKSLDKIVVSVGRTDKDNLQMAYIIERRLNNPDIAKILLKYKK